MRKALTDESRIVIISSKLPFKGKYKNTVGLMDPIREKNKDAVVIWIHPSLAKKEKLKTLIHESLHVAYPDLTEEQVLAGEEILGNLLWREGYRRN